MDQASALCVNPFTAFALFNIALKRNCRTILQNGASGQVGIFIRALAKKSGIRVVNIVRKVEHIEQLRAQGESIIVNSVDPDFEQKLREVSVDKNTCIAFDAVGGDMSGTIINALPDGSELILYGGLSGKPVGGINTLDIIFKGKSIKGFNLGQWKEETGHEKFLEIADELQGLIIKGTLRTRIQGAFQLKEVQAAMEQYIRNMSAGKIIFKP
jgi:NADPH:quinone reductase-like Zn-dependent oxidoreductase